MMNMIKRKLVLLFLIGAVVLFFFLCSKSDESKSTEIYGVETFKSGNGWGYQINKGEKAIIVQPYMPSMNGENPFPDEGLAKEVGELVLVKIKNNKHPSVTIEELNEKITGKPNAAR